METLKIARERKRPMFMIDPRLIVADKDFNVRKNYGDIESLKKSIRVNGVKQPLRGHKVGEYFKLTDGFRRNEAIKSLLKDGFDLKHVPFILEPKNYTNEQRLLDMFIFNDSKKLEPIEEADLYMKLESYGWARKEIAKRIGRTEGHISNMMTLANAPKVLKNAVENGTLSPTTAIGLVRVEKNTQKLIENVQNKLNEAKEQGNNKKISHSEFKKPNLKILSSLDNLMETVKNEKGKEVLSMFYDFISEDLPETVLADFLNRMD